MKTSRTQNRSLTDHDSFSHQAALIREEARRTRSTVWLVALILIGCVFFAPALFAAVPIAALILASCVLAAIAGALLGKFIARRRERRLLSEITRNSDRIIPIQTNPNKEEAEQVGAGDAEEAV